MDKSTIRTEISRRVAHITVVKGSEKEVTGKGKVGYSLLEMCRILDKGSDEVRRMADTDQIDRVIVKIGNKDQEFYLHPKYSIKHRTDSEYTK
jgi:hypothetical protein